MKAAVLKVFGSQLVVEAFPDPTIPAETTTGS